MNLKFKLLSSIRQRTLVRGPQFDSFRRPGGASHLAALPGTTVVSSAIRRMTQAAKAKRRSEVPTGEHPKKYCATCGRLISPSHRNFQDRKYCSKTCATPRRRPNACDREIERRMVELALSERFRRSGVPCGEAERECMDLSEAGQAERPSTEGSAHSRLEVDGDNAASVEGDGVGVAGKGDEREWSSAQSGMSMAQFRERVRRAGRRLIAFGPQEQMDSNAEPGLHRFECVQNGRAVEPSFAKGEWTLRLVAR